mmetsp:Transcript_32459/g.74590  ORF Transcript_32459/g.74590 Transcript_32459/m.74590 type:complete len:104 (-) Transcript_32459:217-528(-)
MSIDSQMMGKTHSYMLHHSLRPVALLVVISATCTTASDKKPPESLDSPSNKETCHNRSNNSTRLHRHREAVVSSAESLSRQRTTTTSRGDFREQKRTHSSDQR